jgi:purine-binding chemotaxis protein CheW
MHTIVIPVGEDLYAVRIEWVNEVLAAPTVTELATAPVVVFGLVNLRGDIVPLLDTAALLGVGAIKVAAFAVVLQTVQGPAALAATGFPQRAELETVTGPSELPGTAGTYQWGSQVTVLLDPAALLAPERIGGTDSHNLVSTVGPG